MASGRKWRQFESYAAWEAFEEEEEDGFGNSSSDDGDDDGCKMITANILRLSSPGEQFGREEEGVSDKGEYWHDMDTY